MAAKKKLRKKRETRQDDGLPEEPSYPDESSEAPPVPPIDMNVFGDELGEVQNVGDVIVLNPLRMKALQAKGIDTRVARVRVERWKADGTGKARMPGEFPPDEVTVAWLKRRWGVGKYGVSAFNSQGAYLAYGTAQVVEDAEVNPASPASGQSTPPGAPAAPAGTSFAEQLLLVMMPLMFQQRAPAPADDSLRETMSAMGKMMAMQLQLQTANALKANGAPAAQKDETLAILKTVLEQSKPAPTRKELGLAEFLPLLNMGMSIGTRMAGGAPITNPTGEKQVPPWLEVLPGLADTIGVPLIATIAQSVLPQDTAKAVLKLMEEHLETRRAEAEAEAAAADAVDTEGEVKP